MRVDVAPQHLEAIPGVTQFVTITVTNTADVIGGYLVRVLGADPDWVQLDASALSIFPEASASTTLRIQVPAGLSAGVRRIGVQVRELTPPESISVEEIDLEVSPAPQMRLSLDATTVSGGAKGSTSLRVENTGNTVLSGRLVAKDPEDGVAFAFGPERVKLSPGARAAVDVGLKARRPWFGNPALRTFEIGFEQSDPFASWEGATGGAVGPSGQPAAPGVQGGGGVQGGRGGAFGGQDAPTERIRAIEAPAIVPFAVEPSAQGVFVQKPRLARLAVSLISLALAVTVFAVVITLVLSQVVSQSAADRQLALTVAEARNSTAGTGTSSIAGTVTLLTSGSPVADVAVQLYNAADASTTIATTHTGDDGTYSFAGLAAGTFKLAFFGAGFAELWYPTALTDSDATPVTLQAGASQTGVDVQLGGLPASIAGTVVGADVSNAQVQLTLPIGTGTTTGTATGTTASAPTADDPTGGAPVVRTVPVGADGTFSITQVPSPSVYDLVVSKPGYATQIQPIDLAGGEARTGVQIMLQEGNGLISGHVTGLNGRLGGATVTATSGTTTIRTISVTQGDVGSFVLRNLPSPATFTVVVSNPGFASSTLTLTLSNGQQLSGVNVVLGTASGALSGAVTLSPGGAAAAGVSVTVSNGALTVQTVTQSQQANATPGAWSVAGLTIPSTYTVTFSRPDLASQTLSVSLDSFGNITSDSQGSAASASQVNVAMLSSTASVQGVVFQHDASTGASVLSSCNQSVPAGDALQGEATITLTSGSSTYTTTSASAPAADSGKFVLAALPPGVYTISISKPGSAPTTISTTLAAGDTALCDVAIATPATVAGQVLDGTTPDNQVPFGGATVVLYLSSQYPTTSVATTTTDPTTGAFAFTGVAAPASYVLEIRSSSGVLGSTPFDLDASEQLTLPPIVVIP